MPLAAELDAALREFAAAGPVEVHDNGTRIAPLSVLSWEVRGNSERPLLHLWSENHNMTRRVLAITSQSETRLTLAVECFGRSKPDHLEFLRTEFERSEEELSREAFAQEVARICTGSFPDDSLESLTCAADLEHSLSGNYVRGVLKSGKTQWALFAVPDGQATQNAERCLTFALLWLDLLHGRAARAPISGIRMMLPSGAAAPIAHLLGALRSDVRVELYERDPVLESLRRIEPAEVANFSSLIVPAKEAQLLVSRAEQELAALIPRRRDGITFHPNVAAKEVVARFRGLSFLRWREDGIWFGARDMQSRWEQRKDQELRVLLEELEMRRDPLASDARHPLFRSQPERWLEFLVREDVTRIDPILDPRFAYAQVTAATGGEHGILDVLSATRSGRLAILELKANEDPVFLLQAAKYWLRIRHHVKQQDFPRYGYFPGVALQENAPIVYLVAPALRFHPATTSIMRFLNPEIEVVRVGVSETWRRGLCVILRQ